MLFYLLEKKENLTGAMFTSRKRVSASAGMTDARMASTWLALVILMVVAAVVAAVVKWT